MSRTFIIAEAGGTHDGDFEKLGDLVAIAKAAGADCFKLQFTSSPSRMAKRRHLPDPSVYELLQLPPSWLEAAATEASHLGLEFMCSTFLQEDVEEVAPWVDRFKIASLEAGDESFLLTHAAYDKPLVISTGTMTAEEVARLDERVRRIMFRASLLLCTSAYPSPLEDLQLRCLGPPFPTWRAMYEGLSDHSGHELTGAVAVGAGAHILEVHYRHPDTSKGNPDYAHSHTPEGLARYVKNVRDAERMVSWQGEKHLAPSETAIRPYRVC